MRLRKILGLLFCVGALFVIGCTKQTVSDPVPETQDASPYSYYVYGEKSVLVASTQNLTITFSEAIPPNPIPPHPDLTFTSTVGEKLMIFTLKSNATLTLEEILPIVRNNNTILSAYPEFSGTKVTEEACFKLKANHSLSDLQTILDNLGFSISFQEKIGDIYFYTISNSNTFNFSNKIYESGMVEFSHPNFISIIEFEKKK